MPLTRRQFLATTTAAGIGLTISSAATTGSGKPAFLGGKPMVTEPIPAWPIFDDAEKNALINTLQSGKWFRGNGNQVAEFEQAYARLLEARHCVGTSSGTNALVASMNAVGVGAGDEVILPPYTFVACVNAILMLGAIPVFVDTDPETFQINAAKIESAITERTSAIMTVHLGGYASDLDAILEIARRHKLAVVEDACQAHLGEWRGRKLGTIATVGCFSFQASKNLTAGEGGAIITDDEALAEKCYAAQYNSYPRKGGRSLIRGANFRMSEFHAAILLEQMKRLPSQARTRDENAARLTQLLKEIPGILPVRPYDGCTRSGHHLYMFRYKKEHFAGLSRASFLKALAAEGIRASSGYRPLNKEPFIAETLRTRGYRRVISENEFSNWQERNNCPANDQLCEEAVWFSQNVLLARSEAMDQIADAIRRIQKNAADLVKG